MRLRGEGRGAELRNGKELTDLPNHDWQSLDILVLSLKRWDIRFNVALQGRYRLIDVHIRALNVVVNVNHVEMALLAVVEEVS